VEDRNPVKRILGIVALVVLPSCGGDMAVTELACSLSFVVVGGDPVEAPATVVLDATVRTELVGFRELFWSVTFEGQAIAHTVRNENDASTIEFAAPQPGPYEVALSGRVGSVACDAGDAAVNVLAPMAAADEYLLQVVPPDGASYARLVTVYGGADSSLGPVDLAQAQAGTRILDSAGAGLAAFVRFVPAGYAVGAAELASTATGEVEVALAPGLYDVVVAPYGDQAPFSASAIDAELPASIRSPTPSSVGVSVTSGTALSGAIVRLAVDEDPAALATTNGAGAAQLEVAPGGALEIEVVPPQGSVLPSLSTTSVGVPSSIGVAYQAPSTRVISFAVVDGGGSPLPGAHVRVSGSVSAAGTIDVGAGAKVVAGRFVRTWVADGSGVVGPVTVPQTLYDVVIDPDGAVPSLATLDVRVGQPSPAQLVYAAPVAITGTVETSGGSSVDGALIRARAIGSLSGLGADGASALTNASGQFSLILASGEDYEVIAEGDPDGAYAHAYTLITAGPGGQADIVVADAIALQGRLQRNADVVSGAQVLLLDPVTGTVIARAVSAADGSFALGIPDPGTQ